MRFKGGVHSVYSLAVGGEHTCVASGVDGVGDVYSKKYGGDGNEYDIGKDKDDSMNDGVVNINTEISCWVVGLKGRIKLYSLMQGVILEENNRSRQRDRWDDGLDQIRSALD
eukprot:Mrub_02658.p5 GENE.Mrub_02658~~Mrub_02658.p5  ORF type:complete len:112 (+),score=17.96 Mrub_02658:787-1122(+)